MFNSSRSFGNISSVKLEGHLSREFPIFLSNIHVIKSRVKNFHQLDQFNFSAHLTYTLAKINDSIIYIPGVWLLLAIDLELLTERL